MNFRRTGGLILAGVAVLVLAFWLNRLYNAAPKPAPAANAAKSGLTNATARTGLTTNAARPVPRPGPAFLQNPAPPTPKAGPPGVPAPPRPSNLAKGPTTNAAAAKAPPAKGLADTFRQYQSKPWFYPALAAIPLALGAFFLWLTLQNKSRNAEAGTVSETALSRAGMKPLKRKAGAAAVHACNVVQIGGGERQVWQFAARNGSFVLNRSQTAPQDQTLPQGMVAKDWRSLFQPKLNVAWLPPEQVFLRVAQFPVSNFDETLSMIELQLEKLSPMPVTQIVWGVHMLPHAKGNMQTAVLMIAARSVVEDFLGQLEGQGYLADRLELPMLDQLQATTITEDGAWIYPTGNGSQSSALVAWWYGGVLQNLDLLALPAANRPESLKEQLTQMAWAGEMEGWLTAPPRWHLVSDETATAEWEPALRAGLDQPVEVTPPLPPSELAGLTAARAAHSEPRANLLPAEFTTRYQQQFVDSLWMGALGAIVGLYVVGVAIYMIALQFVLMQTRAVENEVALNSTSYTNALQLKAQFQVLQDRDDLKFAGLDCWKAVAELLPSEVTLDGFTFSDGKKLALNGTAPVDQRQALLQFDGAMRKYMFKGQLLFDPLKGDILSSRLNPGGSTVSWGCTYELKRAEVQ